MSERARSHPMKKILQQFAPRPRPEFAQKLEHKLLAAGTWEKPSFNFRSMKRLSLIYGSVLILVAVATGLLYPFSASDDYIAQAQAYYENYPDGILYQKKELYMAHPKGYDLSTTYTQEIWSYGGNSLMLTHNVEGDLYEMVANNYMDIEDEYGNHYGYGDPKEYAYRLDTVREAPYCVLQLTAQIEGIPTYSNHAFEVSPEALDVFNRVYLPKGLSYPFDSDGYTMDHMYGRSGYATASELNTASSLEDDKNLMLRKTIVDADSSPEQAQALFDLLASGEEYSHETRVDASGAREDVFHLPAEVFGEDGTSFEEFVFNDEYELLKYSFYTDGKLMEQIKYLETKLLPVSEREIIFNPDVYGFILISFDHPYEIVDAYNALDSEETLDCYSFQNRILDEEETARLAEDYSSMIENIKALWKNDLLPFGE